MGLSSGSIFLEFAQNIALTAIILVAFSLIRARAAALGRVGEQVSLGFAFGAVLGLAMLNPVQVAPDVYCDARATLLVLSGIFGGPLATMIAAAIAAGLRALIGGAAYWNGFVTIACSAAVGVGGHWLMRRRGGLRPRDLLPLAALGAFAAEPGLLLLAPPTRELM